MKELIERLNNLKEALKDAEGKAVELEKAKARIAELEGQLVAKDEEVAKANAKVKELEDEVVAKDKELEDVKVAMDTMKKEYEETRANELAQLDEAISRLEAIVNK